MCVSLLYLILFCFPVSEHTQSVTLLGAQSSEKRNKIEVKKEKKEGKRGTLTKGWRKRYTIHTHTYSRKRSKKKYCI